MIGSFGIGPLAAVSTAPGSIAAARAGEVVIAAVPARDTGRLQEREPVDRVSSWELLSLPRVGRTPFVRPGGGIGSIAASGAGRYDEEEVRIFAFFFERPAATKNAASSGSSFVRLRLTACS